MAIINLTQGMHAIVDDEDYEWLSQWRWTYLPVGYAYRQFTEKGKLRHIQMHRLITNASGGYDVDHKNGNGLDNRKNNLRICNRSQNAANRPKPNKVNSHSKYKGVFRANTSGKWVAQICINYKRKHLGTFSSEKEAAIAYNNAARAQWNEFAFTNNIYT